MQYSQITGCHGWEPKRRKPGPVAGGKDSGAGNNHALAEDALLLYSLGPLPDLGNIR